MTVSDQDVDSELSHNKEYSVELAIRFEQRNPRAYGHVMQPRAVPIESSAEVQRAELVTRGRRLEYLTIGWNTFEAVVALVSGLLAGSVALVGFGLDSVIETLSAGILLWRFRDELHSQKRELTARRMVGVCFLLLAVYIAGNSARALWTRAQPERSLPGILIAVAAVIAMPLLGRAKRRVAAQLQSGALQSDSRQADFCAYLSAILLAGLLLHAWLGWWWADPVAALVMAPIIALEGVQGLRGEACGCGPACE